MTLAPICCLPIRFDTSELLRCVSVILVWHLHLQLHFCVNGIGSTEALYFEGLSLISE